MTIRKSFTTTLKELDSTVWSICIEVPVDIVQYFKENKVKRLLCEYSKALIVPCAILSNGHDEYFININKKIRNQLNLSLDDKLQVTLSADTSEYGMPMPIEFGELLKIDSEGDLYFHKLSPGKQRNLIYIVNQVKRSESRLRKAVVIVEYLKSTFGKLDFKELNEAFKLDRENRL